MGYPQLWYRIDKGNGKITVVNGVNVVRAAQGSFKKPNHAIATGRFMTPFAIYSSGENLTPDEDRALAAEEPVDTCANCGGKNLGSFVCSDCGTSTLLSTKEARS